MSKEIQLRLMKNAYKSDLEEYAKTGKVELKEDNA